MNNPERLLSDEDWALAVDILGDTRIFYPDLVIAPDGEPYLYRWELIKTHACSVYFHIQVRSDPERPLHDHPWDNQSVILSGGYNEYLDKTPQLPGPSVYVCKRKVGDVIFREAHWAHRLLMPDGAPYTMTLFSTGPKIREWGFWYPQGWVPHTDVCRMVDGVSVHDHSGAKA